MMREDTGAFVVYDVPVPLPELGAMPGDQIVLDFEDEFPVATIRLFDADRARTVLDNLGHLRFIDGHGVRPWEVADRLRTLASRAAPRLRVIQGGA